MVLAVIVEGVSGSFSDGGKSEGRVYRELEKVYRNDERTNQSLRDAEEMSDDREKGIGSEVCV